MKDMSDGVMTWYFRLGLVSRTLDAGVVEDWATRRVCEVDVPPIPTCELAMARTGDRAAVLGLLRDFPRSVDEEDAGWAVFSRGLHDELAAGRRSLKDTVRVLYELEQLHELPEHLSMPVSILEDAYAQARDAVYGNLDDVKRRTLELLRTCFDETPPPATQG